MEDATPAQGKRSREEGGDDSAVPKKMPERVAPKKMPTPRLAPPEDTGARGSSDPRGSGSANAPPRPQLQAKASSSAGSAASDDPNYRPSGRQTQQDAQRQTGGEQRQWGRGGGQSRTWSQAEWDEWRRDQQQWKWQRGSHKGSAWEEQKGGKKGSPKGSPRPDFHPGPKSGRPW